MGNIHGGQIWIAESHGYRCPNVKERIKHQGERKRLKESMETVPLPPLKWSSTASKRQVETPDKLCFSVEDAIRPCPWNRVRKFLVRKMINQAKFGVVAFESEDPLGCAPPAGHCG